MHKLPFVGLDARDRGEPPCIQDPSSVDQDVRIVFNDVAGRDIFHFNFPLRCLLIPGRMGYLMLQANVFLQPVFD